jgi:hypothetical protein
MASIDDVRPTEPINTKTTEPKVKAAALGTYVLGVVLVGLFGAFNDSNLISVLPDYVTAILTPLLPTLAAWVAGYNARHQYRAGEGSGA